MNVLIFGPTGFIGNFYTSGPHVNFSFMGYTYTMNKEQAEEIIELYRSQAHYRIISPVHNNNIEFLAKILENTLELDEVNHAV